MINVYDWINTNLDALTRSIPGRGKTYLDDTCTVKIQFEITYSNAEDYDTFAKLAFNITSADQPLQITNLKMLTNNSGVKWWKTQSDTSGFYIFSSVQPIYSNRLFVYAEKSGYIRSDAVAIGAISAGDSVTRNLNLKSQANPPAPPDTIEATVVGQSINITWSPSIGALSYKVYFDNAEAPITIYSAQYNGIDSIKGKSPYTVSDVTQRSVQFNGLNSGNWRFVVKAVNASGESEYSKEARAYLPMSTSTIASDTFGNANFQLLWEISTSNFSPPAAKYETADYVNYTLSWEAISGVSGYEIIEAANPNFNNKAAGAYYYRIRAVSGNYKSQWGDVITMSVQQTGGVLISW